LDPPETKQKRCCASPWQQLQHVSLQVAIDCKCNEQHVPSECGEKVFEGGVEKLVRKMKRWGRVG